MPIADIQYLDDDSCRLTISNGEEVDLRLEDNEVGIYADEGEVGRLAFRLLRDARLVCRRSDSGSA